MPTGLISQAGHALQFPVVAGGTHALRAHVITILYSAADLRPSTDRAAVRVRPMILNRFHVPYTPVSIFAEA